MKRGGALRSRSRKRARQERAYTLLRREYLEQHPWCEFPVRCHRAATEVHHKRGRVGADLLDTTHWAALCSPHHQFATVHPHAAVVLGISELRTGRRT